MVDQDEELVLNNYQAASVSDKNHHNVGSNEVGMNQASLFSVSAALTNNILGAGVLGIPHAFAECGYHTCSFYFIYIADTLLEWFF